MNKTKIEWTDYTWNPITGCLHDCPYCYARKTSKRFSGDVRLNLKDPQVNQVGPNIYEIEKKWESSTNAHIPFPLGFLPTLHKYRLDYPKTVVNGVRVFVCSMSDMFGDWVPDAWIEQIFNACEEAPQHQYLFLTKNPKRYTELAQRGILRKKDNFWYGSTVTTQTAPFFHNKEYNTFLSIEPIAEPFDKFEGLIANAALVDWVIVGAETGNRYGKIVPEKSWITPIVEVTKKSNTPLFMKNSLEDIVGADEMVFDVPEKLNAVAHKVGGKDLYYSHCGLCKKEFKKNEMHTILNKTERLKGAKVIGYICDNCFHQFEETFK